MARPQPRYHLHNKTQQKRLGKQRLAEAGGMRGRDGLSLVGLCGHSLASLTGGGARSNDVASLSGKRQIGNAYLRGLDPLLREP